MDKVILEKLKHLNDSVIAILLLMPITLVTTFEAFDPLLNLRYLSHVDMLNKILVQYIQKSGLEYDAS